MSLLKFRDWFNDHSFTTKNPAELSAGFFMTGYTPTEQLNSFR